MMKRFLKQTILFILCCTVGYPFFVFVWGLTGSRIFYSNLNYAIDMPGYMYTRIQELKRKDSVDVLIVGSSHAYRGVDTRPFEAIGVSAFNLGSSSQSPVQTRTLIQRYLDHVNPEVVIYEVAPHFFSVDGVESALNIIGADKNDKYSWKMATTINNIKVYNTLLYGYIRDFLHLDDSFSDPESREGDLYVPGGFVERELQPFNNQMLAEEIQAFNEKQWDAFDETIQFLKEREINYILVSAPVTGSLYMKYANWPKFEERIHRFGVYYNFNEIIFLDDSGYFYDPEHLNQYGVEIFTSSLIDILKDTGLIN